MPRFASQFMAAALAATFAAGSVVPVNAAPIVAPVDANNSNGIIKVQQSRAVQEFTGPGTGVWQYVGDREWRRANRHLRREFRRDRREFRRDRREFRQARRDFRRGDITRREFRQARREFRGERREFRRDRRDFRRGLVRRGDWWYYNGYRGYRHYHPGYREYNGWWFPLAAFAAGAIITGAINDRDYYDGNNWNAHVRWCYAKYRSYREWDNTYQPYHGPRRQCYSPYS